MLFLSNVVVDSRPCGGGRAVPYYRFGVGGGSMPGAEFGPSGSIPSECVAILLKT